MPQGDPYTSVQTAHVALLRQPLMLPSSVVRIRATSVLEPLPWEELASWFAILTGLEQLRSSLSQTSLADHDRHRVELKRRQSLGR